MYFLKIILSLSGAVMLATLPGFLDVNYNLGGFSVRAAGGAAAFVFIYTQSPNLPVLKLDPAARPAPQQERAPPKSDHLSSIPDELPILMAFSFAQANVRGGQTRSESVTVYADSSGAASGSGTLSELGIGEAVRADAGAAIQAATAYVQSAIQSLRMVLDAAAGAFRQGVSTVIASARRLFGVEASGADTAQNIALVTDELSGGLDALTDPLIGQDASPFTTLLTGLGSGTESFAGGLTSTVEGIVSATDKTVQTLASNVQNTTRNVLEGAQGLVGGVTGLLDDTTGGLASGLTAPANKLAGGVAETAGTLVDAVVPKAADTTSQILNGVGAGIGRITEGLNAVSPAIVSGINPDFLSAHGLPLTSGAETLAEPSSLLGKLNGTLGGLTDSLGGREPGLLRAGGDQSLFAGRFADQLGGEKMATGAACISGCGQGSIASSGGGLADAVGNGIAQRPLLGRLDDDGSGTGAGHAGSAGGADQGGRGGPISSAVGTAGSIAKGVTNTLGRRR